MALLPSATNVNVVKCPRSSRTRIARQEILTDDITTSAAEQDGKKFHALIVELNELWQEKEHRSLDTGQSRRQPNSRSPQLDGCSTGRQRREARTQETTPVRTGASRCSGVLLPGTNHPIIRMGIVGTEGATLWFHRHRESFGLHARGKRRIDHGRAPLCIRLENPGRNRRAVDRNPL
jgi:hypothetical protein